MRIGVVKKVRASQLVASHLICPRGFSATRATIMMLGIIMASNDPEDYGLLWQHYCGTNNDPELIMASNAIENDCGK